MEFRNYMHFPGGSVATSTTSHAKLPSMTYQSIEMWIYLYETNSHTGSNYLIDGRDGLANSWIYSGSPGGNWTKMYVDGVAKASVSLDHIPRNKLTHIYFEFSAPNLVPVTTLLARYSLNETTKANLYMVRTYSRALTASEVQASAKGALHTGEVGTFYFDSGTVTGSNGVGNVTIVGGQVRHIHNPHEDSILGLSRCLPVDSQTSFLAHYDVTEEESLSGVRPLGYSDALTFNGTTGYVDLGNHPLLNPSSTITVECWFKTDKVGSSTYRPHIIGGTNKYYLIMETTGEAKFYIYNTGWIPVTGTTVLAADTWYHLAGTYDGTNIRIFVNGVLEGTYAVTTSLNQTTGSTYIGYAYSGATSQWHDGTISDVRIWNVARSESDIKQNMDSVLTGNETGLVGYWKLNEGDGLIVIDSSPNKNAGTVIDGCSWGSGRTVASIRPHDGIYGGAVAVETATRNYIGNGGMFDGSFPTGAHEDYTTGKYQVVPTPFPNPINSPYVLKCLPTVANSEFEIVSSGVVPFVTGKYTLSCYIWVSHDWDAISDANGMKLFHNRWYDASGIITEHVGQVHIKRGVWQRVSLTMDMGVRTPTSFNWFFMYPNSSTKGVMYATGFQVEAGDFATSFIDGNRSTGVLKYPADCINPSEGTISFWVNPQYPLSSVVNQYNSPKFIQAGTYYRNSSFSIWNINNTEGKVLLYVKGIASAGWIVSALNVGFLSEKTWSMITVTWKGKVWKTYMNGKLTTTTTASEVIGPIADNVLYVGGDGDGTTGNGKPANSLLDEVRIDQVERTPEEILAWYESQAPFFPKGVHRIYF